MALIVFAITLFVSAFLLFLVQPMIGKMILPKLGGTPQVWNTCMLFFQTVLLAGYFYTHAATTYLKPRMQMILHCCLLALPIFVMLALRHPFDVSGWTPPVGSNPIFATLALLLAVVGVPFFVVSTSAPLLQKWFSFSGDPTAKDPYFLYGASNLGSLLSLGFYPFLVEPMFEVPHQTWIWFFGYVALAIMVVGSAMLVWKQADTSLAMDSGPAPESVAPNPLPAEAVPTAQASTAIQPSKQLGKKKGLKAGVTAPAAPVPSVARKPAYDPVTAPLTVWRCIRWALLAAVPSSLMLGVTSYVSTDLSPFPLLWAIPLGLYLLSFILVFSKWPLEWTKEPHQLMLYMMPVCVMVLCMVLVSRDYSPVGLSTAASFLSFFIITMALHGELAKDRPSARHLTLFFLMMSFGGMLGGLFNALLSPIIFTGIVEYPVAIIVASLLRPNLVEQGWTDAWIMDAAPDLRKSMSETSDNMSKSLGMKPDGTPWVFSYLMDVIIGLLLAFFIWLTVMKFRVEIVSGFEGMLRFVGVSEASVDNWGEAITRLAMYGLPVVAVLLTLGRKLRFAIGATFFILMAYYWMGDSERTVYAGRSYYGVLRVQRGTAHLRDIQGGRSYVEVLDGDKNGMDPFLKDADGNEIYTSVRLRNNEMAKVASAPFNYLMHGSTYHGRNYQVPELERLATTYYHRLGPVGVIMERFNWFPGEQNTYWADSRLGLSFILAGGGTMLSGVPLPLDLVTDCWSEPPFATVGLGTGTMASYVRPYQHMAYYEIDDKIKHMSVPEDPNAKPLFTYVDRATKRGGNVEIIMGDARLSLEKEKEREAQWEKDGRKDKDGKYVPTPLRDNYYHALVLDAFSSDAIPVHLITEEAVKLYMSKLVKDGVLLVHTSNRHLKLTDPVADIAQKLKLEAFIGKDDRPGRDETSPEGQSPKIVNGLAELPDPRDPRKKIRIVRSLGHFGSEYIMLARPGVLTVDKLKHSVKIPGIKDDEVSHVHWTRAEPPNRRVWTDQYQNIVSIMR